MADLGRPADVLLAAAVLPIRQGLPGKHHGADPAPVGIGVGSGEILSGIGDRQTIAGFFVFDGFQDGGTEIREKLLDKVLGFGKKGEFKAPAVEP
jgi:hypothetical protein